MILFKKTYWLLVFSAYYCLVSFKLKNITIDFFCILLIIQPTVSFKHFINHSFFGKKGNKTLVGNALALAGGQLGNKSPNLQSPPNVSVAKNNVVDPLSLSSLPSSIANSAALQSMANNGSSPQVMSSIQGSW